MLKKLRRRFITLSMTLVGIVLFFFYVFIVALMLVRVSDSVQTSLANIASVDYLSQTLDIGEDVNNSTLANTIDFNSVCVVEINSFGEIAVLDIGHGYMSDAVLEEVTKYALYSEDEFGHIDTRHLFFSKTKTLFGTRIAFADSMLYYNYIKGLFIDGAIVLLSVMMILYFINRRLCAIFLKPVEKTWAQQQNFIADASHELKTPLTVILANVDILQAHGQNTVDEQMKWVVSTNEEATHMKELVDKMLLLAKSDNMKKNIVFNEVDFSQLATKLTLQFEPVAYENGVNLQSNIDENIIIKGDQTILNQIMLILLDNAVKYAGLGGDVFFVLTKKQNYVFLNVKNTGKPIPPEDLPHIFERFYRSDKARTAGNGYGLGLAICQSLCETSKAEISVESDENNGTVFSVKFKTKKSRLT